jgi:anti-sigma regulatory factor (Ser/Thr protein kinase)
MDSALRPAPRPSARPVPRGRHDAVMFDSDDAFVAAAAAHLREGARLGEELVVACTTERAHQLLESVDDPSEVTVLGNGDTYPTPCGAMESYVVATQRAIAHGSTGLRVVGELPVGTDDHPHTWPGWSRYEALVNDIFLTLPFNALCAYDARKADDSLLSAVTETHTHLWRDGVRHVNGYYRDPADCLARWSDPPVLPLERSAPLLEVRDIRDAAGVRAARRRVGDLLSRHDTALVSHADHLPPADPSLVEASEYLLGVDEVLVNALVHGRGPTTLRLWAMHDRVVTTVTDPGPGFHDPYRGYTTRPVGASKDTPPRLGLWLARQMSDELTFRHDDEGFTVRLRADLDVRFG